MGRFDAVAADYDRSSPGVPDSFLRLLLTRLGVIQGSSVVDLGCGSGRLALSLARRGAQVIGVDCSRVSLAIAKRRDTGNLVEWVLSAAENFRPLSVPVDAVLAFEAFHLFANPQQVVSNVAQYLRRAGTFTVGWSEYHWESKLRESVARIFSEFGFPFSDWGYWTCPGFPRLLERSSGAFTRATLRVCEVRESISVRDIAAFLVSIDKTAHLPRLLRRKLMRALIRELGSSPDEHLSGTTRYCIRIARRR